MHSKRHFVFDQDGNQVAQWGLKVWSRPNTKQKDANRQNAHIPRQKLRKSNSNLGLYIGATNFLITRKLVMIKATVTT